MSATAQMKTPRYALPASARDIAVLIICHLAAGLLYLSWYQTQEFSINEHGMEVLQYGGTTPDGFWQRIDYGVFRTLNGSLRDNKSAQTFWALANNRAFDLAYAFLMGLGLWFSVFRNGTPGEKLERIKVGAFLLITTVIFVQACRYSLFDFSRPSASLALKDEAIRLSLLDHVTWSVKDSSGSCFPGDHGAVLFVGALYITYFSSLRWGLLAFIVAILCTLPRVVAGAHWATDIIVGSTFIALVSSSWTFCGPGWRAGPALFHRPCLYLMKIAGQFPPAGKASAKPDGKK